MAKLEALADKLHIELHHHHQRHELGQSSGSAPQPPSSTAHALEAVPHSEGRAPFAITMRIACRSRPSTCSGEAIDALARLR
jgi:hypothetical protein